jgi:hypothetical protein
MGATMTHFELKPVRHLAVADLLELPEDVRLYRVMRIEGDLGADAQRKVHVRSLDGSTHFMLVRQGKDQVRVAIRQ